MSRCILVVDDEKNIRKTLRSALEEEGYRVWEAENGATALKIFEKKRPHGVLLDIWMDGMDGMEVLKRMKGIDDSVAVVMMSGHGNIETAVKSTKLGAFDFIEKPLSLDKILLVLHNMLSVHELREENKQLRQQVDQKFEMVYGSKIMEALKSQIDVAAPSNSWILITGENGTGKELVAWRIHQQSKRASKPFVAVNCAAIPEELIESELFGHEKGAFTGATASKKGKFEIAHRGTLFLDEVGDMSLKTQAKILRALQEKKFERVGGTQTFEADVRVIGATNKDLQKEISLGNFRQDLYYRLNVIPFDVAPLRERREDITHLVSHFLKRVSEENGKKKKKIGHKALQILESYDWPGNVRELKNVVERLFIMTPGDLIQESDLPPYLCERNDRSVGAEGFKQAKMNFEKDYIKRKLREFDGNVSRTARAIGMERTNLHRKMKIYQIES